MMSGRMLHGNSSVTPFYGTGVLAIRNHLSPGPRRSEEVQNCHIYHSTLYRQMVKRLSTPGGDQVNLKV